MEFQKAIREEASKVKPNEAFQKEYKDYHEGVRAETSANAKGSLCLSFIILM